MTQISENTTIGLFKVKSKNAFFEKQGVFLLALVRNVTFQYGQNKHEITSKTFVFFWRLPKVSDFLYLDKVQKDNFPKIHYYAVHYTSKENFELSKIVLAIKVLLY
jgi:hypothetical protein